MGFFVFFSTHRSLRSSAVQQLFGCVECKKKEKRKRQNNGTKLFSPYYRLWGRPLIFLRIAIFSLFQVLLMLLTLLIQGYVSYMLVRLKCWLLPEVANVFTFCVKVWMFDESKSTNATLLLKYKEERTV